MVKLWKIREAADDATLEKSSTTGKFQLNDDFEARLIRQVAENSIESMELKAGVAVTDIVVRTNLIVDTFAGGDATGEKGIASECSAEISGDKLVRRNLPTTSEAHGVAMATTDNNNNGSDGISFTADYTFKCSTVTKKSTCTATSLNVKDSAGTLLANYAFSGNVATINRIFEAGEKYRLECTGTNFTRAYNSGGGLPIAHSLLTWDDFSESGVDKGNHIAMNIESIQVSSDPVYVKVAIPAASVAGTLNYSMLVVNAPDRETGDEIEYLIGDGTHEDDSLPINTKNAVVTATGTPTYIKIKLLPKSSSPTDGKPSLRSYSLVLWTTAASGGSGGGGSGMVSGFGI